MYGDFCKRYEKDQMDICKLICDYAEKAYDMGYEEGTKKVQADHNGFWSGFKLGREDGWKLVRNLLSLSHEELHEIFWTSNMKYIVEHYNFYEAVEKIEKYEEQQKHTDKGDKGCESCKYEDEPEFTSPCVDCSRNHKDMWEAKR